MCNICMNSTRNAENGSMKQTTTKKRKKERKRIENVSACPENNVQFTSVSCSYKIKPFSKG